MRVRILAVSVLCSGISLAACSGGSTDKASGKNSPSASSGESTSQAAPKPPAGFRKIGGPKNGFTAAVPKNWVPVDLSSADAGAALKKAGLNSGFAKLALTTLKRNHAAFAADPESARKQHFATNVNGFCQAGSPATPAQTKAALKQIGAQNIKTKDITINGQSGLKVTYVGKASADETNAVQYQVTGGAGKTCFITMTAKKGVPTPFAKIATTIHVL